MDQPTPAEGWPDGPLTEEEVRDLLGGTDHTDDPVRAVWVFDGVVRGHGRRSAMTAPRTLPRSPRQAMGVQWTLMTP